MKKQINFHITNDNKLSERVIHFFTQSGFKLVDSNKDNFKFIHSSSILETWTCNPLEWGSEITVSIKGKEVIADFYIDTDSQMNTVEEEKVWNNFIANFKSYLTENQAFQEVNKKIITQVKRSRLNYLSWAVIGTLVGGLVGVFFSNLTGYKILGYITIPIMATLFLKYRINYKKEKNALQ